MLMIATASIIIAIVPNSGTTFENTTSSPIGPVLGSSTPKPWKVIVMSTGSEELSGAVVCTPLPS